MDVSVPRRICGGEFQSDGLAEVSVDLEDLSACLAYACDAPADRINGLQVFPEFGDRHPSNVSRHAIGDVHDLFAPVVDPTVRPAHQRGRRSVATASATNGFRLRAVP